MSSTNLIKRDITFLCDTFTEQHEYVHISASDLSDLKVRIFTDKSKKESYILNATVPDHYPNEPAFWFAETERDELATIIEELNTNKMVGCAKNLINNLVLLLEELTKLCHINNSVQDIAKLKDYLANYQTDNGAETTAHSAHDDADSDDFEFGVGSDSDSDSAADKQIAQPQQQQHWDLFMRVQEKQLTDEKVGRPTLPLIVTNRLLKELKDIHSSTMYKDKHYEIEFDNDEINNWLITVHCLDNESPLYKSMENAKKRKPEINIPKLKFNMIFDASFPFNPPFVRIVEPRISGGYVVDGGAICFQLLTQEGWSSAYSIESIIVQITATVSSGVVLSGRTVGTPYTLKHAKANFKHIESYHKMTGWNGNHQAS